MHRPRWKDLLKQGSHGTPDDLASRELKLAQARGIAASPADPELVEWLALLKEMEGDKKPKALAQYLREAVIGKETTFTTAPTQVEEVRQLCTVTVPVPLARNWTVTLQQPTRTRMQIALGGHPCSDDILQCYARIRWGVGGAHHEVHVDWGQGCTMCFWGDHVQVEAVMPVVSGAVYRWPLTIGASITPSGANTPSVHPTKSEYYGDIAAGGAASGYREVPRFAKRCWFHYGGYPTFTANWADQIGGRALGFMTYAGGAGRTEGDRAIATIVPPQATVLRVLNTHATQVMYDLVVIYELAI